MRFGAISRPSLSMRADMLDFIFLTLGLGAFALFGGYARLLRRL